ncbi:NAD(P)H-hydrate dehydratase [Planococcus dechangensis]|uniref:ADP-dependent (S)-NAD(P)H-hydrate dehydratase n=1 Tax=Planococcus dechangensis TaxID=1176255 RepID=A0ABV9MAF1_9BACL
MNQLHEPTIIVWSQEMVRHTLPKRKQESHKGSFGTALLLAGGPVMPGAALLAGLAALRSGVGKLEIGTSRETIRSIAHRTAEATYIPDALQNIANGSMPFSHYRAIACGPGTLPDAVTEAAVDTLLTAETPLLLDAGALSKRRYPERTAPLILTPHTGEFERISGFTQEEILQFPASCAHSFALEHHAAVVLKGPSTIIALPDGRVFQNSTGNSALAKGGTGDTLTGMILGMLTCHVRYEHAILNAVFLHGACADEFIKTRSAHTMLAHEISELLPFVWKSYE